MHVDLTDRYLSFPFFLTESKSHFHWFLSRFLFSGAGDFIFRWSLILRESRYTAAEVEDLLLLRIELVLW